MVTHKEQVFAALYQHHTALQQLGVRRYGLFGSFVRDEAQPTSDVDLLVEFEPHQKTFDHYMQVAFLLEDILGRPVDVVTPESLSPYIGSHIIAEAEYVTISA